MYSLYLTMLNMIDYTAYDVTDREMLYINHYAFVMVLGILLLNLLIAVFSNTMARIKENQEVGEPILNRRTFKALPTHNLPTNEVKLISSAARKCLKCLTLQYMRWVAHLCL